VWVVAVRPRQLPAGPAATFPFGGADAHGIVGESPVAWSLRHTVAFCAPRAAHALVQGPSGSGKELVARALHRAGPDASGPFVSRNAATLPEGLVDAELFGNRAGYPNPGMPEREGLVGAAHRGTLFLDELGELPEAVQAHLLRVLDDGEYQRLGDARVRRSAFRLVGATNRADDHLKHDVLARLPLRIEAPGLNERSDDVGLLVRHLLGRLLSREPDLAARFVDGDGRPRVSCALVAALAARSWTTHVRELEAALWRAMAHSRGDTVELPPGEPTEPAPVDAWVGAAPADLPPEVIQAALDACNGVQSAAAERLGLASRYQLGRLIKRHGLVVRRRRE
jgi:DNA-binding NtrC family response regulator